MEALALIGTAFVGTFFWVVNPEAATALFASQRAWPALLVGALAASGQGAAHALLFFFGGQLRRRWRWFNRQCERAQERHGKLLARGTLPLACTSGLAGVPPALATVALAPGLGLRASRILPALFLMRIVRFTVVAAVAGAASGRGLM
jgi:membrane protein YqaA with SNARE-associated domain